VSRIRGEDHWHREAADGRIRYTTEQIIRKLREAEVEISNGSTVSQAVRKIGMTEQTYYRWRRE
jgi:putative transposase